MTDRSPMLRYSILLLALAGAVMLYKDRPFPHIDYADQFVGNGTIPEAAPICGDSGDHRVQPVYVFLIGSTNNYTQSIPLIRSIAKQIDEVFVASSTGRRRV